MFEEKLKFRAIKNSSKNVRGIFNCPIGELEILISSIEELEIHLGILGQF
jgi:predicted transport protein